MNFIKINPPHQDIVNDIAFDYYGKKFATCSSDKSIKIWNYDSKLNQWVPYTITRAHQDCIWRISWANPEFGQVIASCSEDSYIIIFEEQESVSPANTQNIWKRKSFMSFSKLPVKDVKFSPKRQELKLASVSADGYLRIHQPQNDFDLSKWVLVSELQVDKSEHGLTCVSWSDSSLEGYKLAVGGYSKKALVFSLEGNNLKEECTLEAHKSPVSDISWAPSMGRSYHTIATAYRENEFKIHILKIKDNGSLEYSSTQTIETASKSNIWRVTWNATGTILATSADDGTLGLWRKNFSGQWINVQNISSGLENKLNHFYLRP